MIILHVCEWQCIGTLCAKPSGLNETVAEARLEKSHLSIRQPYTRRPHTDSSIRGLYRLFQELDTEKSDPCPPSVEVHWNELEFNGNSNLSTSGIDAALE